ncbi:acyl-phosphate glycerol 3-phosphate acyltransferase [Corynebacterium sp. 13CS0277]|uniref:HAD-IIB family hydrolase n=1 Tax=Corynebacterium sp. 13CS0277 TaxID=2071994 RepID=UPI000D022640|nr:HAD-IIB family hydrolase [Corynebacterium sp. 13CS0277]PRQ11883.1 acyl-phosphate glycerol 3-phosphate acyltransferase [Corynebacterium sp. 13CS0277]
MRKDRFYNAVIRAAKGVFAAQDLQFTLTGVDNVPTGGAVVVANHTGYLDFTYVGIPFWEHSRRLVRFMAKAEVWNNPIAGFIMRQMRHIPVDRIDTEASYDTAVRYLKDGELVGVFPEGTVSRSLEIKKLRTGAVRMAKDAGVPIVPVLLIGSQRVLPKWGKKNLGRSHTPIDIEVLPPWTVPADMDVADATAHLRGMMSDALTAMWGRYAEAHGPLPQGAEWVPARFGGGALTLEEAQKLDDDIVAERRRVRHLRDDLEALADTVAATLSSMSAASKELVVAGADKTAAQAAATASTARGLLESLADDAASGAKEGAAKLSAAGGRLKALAAQIPASVPPQALDALNQLIAEAKQIRDRLPARVGSRVAQLPQAVVSDIDGTIYYERVVTDAVRDTFTELRDLGVEVFLATGRAPEELEKVLVQLPFRPIVVSANGALVIDTSLLPEGTPLTEDTAEHTIIMDASFAADTVAGVRDAINAARVAGGGTPLAQMTSHEHTAAGQVVKFTIEADAPATDIADILNEHLQAMDVAARASFSAAYGYAEIMPRGVTKATALDWLFISRGIDPQRVIAFGDMRNDVEMLDLVGTGVAMGRGDAELISRAQWVTGPVDRDGVPEFLAPIIARARERRAGGVDAAGAGATGPTDTP